MDILFIASVAVVAADPPESRRLYVDALGLPLEGHNGEGYYSSEKIGGSKHFGVWPLSEAAQACFNTSEWPADRPIPQVSIEFEVEDPAARESSGRGAGGQRLLATASRAAGAVGTNDRETPLD
jgi:catechol 2,3-dioxygenase-like lactoylglutathione lyase family enzyme